MAPSNQFNIETSSVSPAQIMDAMMLAFRNSNLRSWLSSTGEDKVRAVLERSWRRMSDEDTLFMQALLDDFRGVAGFSTDNCVSAFCRIKTWEPHFKMRVELPPEFLARGILDPSGWALGCKVAEADLAAVLPSSVGGSSAARKGNAPARAQVFRPVKDVNWGARVALTVAIAALGAGLLGGVGWWRMRTVPLDVNAVSDQIPLSTAERQGPKVRATLREPAWLTFPAADRSRALEAAYLRTRKNLGNVTEVELLDPQGKTVAVVRGDGQVLLLK